MIYLTDIFAVIQSMHGVSIPQEPSLGLLDILPDFSTGPTKIAISRLLCGTKVDHSTMVINRAVYILSMAVSSHPLISIRKKMGFSTHRKILFS